MGWGGKVGRRGRGKGLWVMVLRMDGKGKGILDKKKLGKSLVD